jgi:type II secretory pathway component PulC
MLRWLLVLAVTTSTARADDDHLYTCKEATPDTKISVTFKPDASLRDLAVWLGGFTCRSVVYSAEVVRAMPTVTIIAPRALTPKQALQLFVDAVESTGLVVAVRPDTIVIKLGPNMPRNCPDVGDLPPLKPAPTPPSRSTPPPFKSPVATSVDDADEIQAAIDAGVREIDPNTHEVTRALVDKVLLNPMGVAKGARVVPAVKDGKPDGFKLYAIRPNSLYAKLGLQNGDTLQSINGLALTSADAALEVYTKVRDARRLELAIVRRGSPVKLVVLVK